MWYGVIINPHTKSFTRDEKKEIFNRQSGCLEREKKRAVVPVEPDYAPVRPPANRLYSFVILHARLKVQQAQSHSKLEKDNKQAQWFVEWRLIKYLFIYKMPVGYFI